MPTSLMQKLSLTACGLVLCAGAATFIPASVARAGALCNSKPAPDDDKDDSTCSEDPAMSCESCKPVEQTAKDDPTTAPATAPATQASAAASSSK